MKHIRPLLTPLLALTLPSFAFSAPAPAGGDPFVKESASAAPAPKVQNAPELVGFTLLTFEVYALDKHDALSVLESETGSAARYGRVLDLSKAGKARLEILTALASKNGQRAAGESRDAVRFPTEFKFPRSRNGVAAPDSFETREVGDIFEYEIATPADDHGLNINLAPNRVVLAGFRDLQGMAGDSVVSQPQFRSQRIATSTTVKPGEPTYLGTFTPARTTVEGQDSPEIWIAFLHATPQRQTAAEDKAAKPADWSAVNLEYSWYSLDRQQAREILVNPTSLEAPWEKLQAAIAQKKARFEHLTTIKTTSGQRAVAEEVEESRFAGDYDPDGQSQTANQTDPAPAAAESPAKKEGKKQASPKEETAANPSDANSGTSPGGPIAFETRNLGVTIEVEPTVDPAGTSVEVNQALQNVAYLGDLKATGIAAKYPPQPVFEKRMITSTQNLPVGRHVLVGTLNPPGADGVNGQVDTGRTWIVFVRGTPNEP